MQDGVYVAFSHWETVPYKHLRDVTTIMAYIPVCNYKMSLSVLEKSMLLPSNFYDFLKNCLI